MQINTHMHKWPKFTKTSNDFVSQFLKDTKNLPHFTG